MKTQKGKNGKSNPKSPVQIQDPETQAAALFQKLEQERGNDTISLNTTVKSYPTRLAIFAVEPNVQIEFVRLVVRTIAKLGKSTGKIPMESRWFNDVTIPFGAEEVAKQLMRRRLPFTDPMLAEILQQIGRMDFVTFAPVLEPLVRELKARKKERALSPKLRKLLPRSSMVCLSKGGLRTKKIIGASSCRGSQAGREAEKLAMSSLSQSRFARSGIRNRMKTACA
jgi:hypothetical protein